MAVATAATLLLEVRRARCAWHAPAHGGVDLHRGYEVSYHSRGSCRPSLSRRLCVRSGACDACPLLEVSERASLVAYLRGDRAAQGRHSSCVPRQGRGAPRLQFSPTTFFTHLHLKHFHHPKIPPKTNSLPTSPLFPSFKIHHFTSPFSSPTTKTTHSLPPPLTPQNLSSLKPTPKNFFALRAAPPARPSGPGLRPTPPACASTARPSGPSLRPLRLFPLGPAGQRRLRTQ